MPTSDDTEDIAVIYTDGACSGNPGPGGWGVYFKWGEHERELYGAEKNTTNNRMELTAAIMALETLKRPATVRLFTDSSYVRNGIMTWIQGWKRNGWVNAKREPVKNADLWQRLEKAAARLAADWGGVRGHAGDPGNERADALACKGRDEAAGRR
jgi:ribonuclease HI